MVDAENIAVKTMSKEFAMLESGEKVANDITPIKWKGTMILTS